MIRKAAAFFLLLVFCHAAFAQGEMEKRSFDSANHKFRVVIDQDPAILASEAIATMMEIREGSGEVKWRRGIGDALFLMANRSFVSERGEFFIAVSLGESPKVYSEKGVVELNFGSSNANSFERIFALDAVGAKEIFRAWNPLNDQWQAFNLPEGTALQPTEALKAAWNEKTRAEILIKRANYEKALMQQRLFAKSRSLAAAAKLLPSKEVASLDDIDCVFLADRKIPADRKWFETMLAKRDFAAVMPMEIFSARPPGVYSFEERDSERRRADATLAIFDGQAKYAPVKGLLRAKLHFLGVVEGRVQLSTPILRRPGTLRVSLIPVGLEKREWIDAHETEKLDCELAPWEENVTNVVDHVEFKFGSVTPGRYFVKAVWDKRAPFDNRAEAGPGDYESNLVGPVIVTAGATTSKLVIECTNRVGGGESYYAADELARRKWAKGELVK